MKLPPLTYTFLRNAENCLRKAYHVNIAKDVPFEDSEALRWGNQVHKAMEERINRGTPLPESMAKWEKFCQFGNYMVKAELKLGIRENGRPCDFFDSDVALRGKVDVLVEQREGLGSAVLVDWKTGKKREDPEELEIHAVMLKALRPEFNRITGHYVWLGQDAVGPSHDLSATETKLADINARRQELQRNLEVGYWPPQQNPLCDWCSVKTCEFNPRRVK